MHSKAETKRIWKRPLHEDVQFRLTWQGLSWLAFQITSGKVSRTRSSEITNCIQSWLSDQPDRGELSISDILGLSRDAQILIYIQDRYQFRHKLLEEFFSAWNLSNCPELLTDNLLDTWLVNSKHWQVFILYSCFLAKEDRQLWIERLLGNSTDPYVWLAAVCWCIEPIDNDPLKQKLVNAIRENLENNPFLSQEKIEFTREIQHFTARQGLDLLILIHKGARKVVRTIIYQLVSRIAIAGGIEWVARVGLREEEKDISDAVIKSLITAGKPSLWPAIHALTSPSEDKRYHAARVIQSIGSPDAVPFLLHCQETKGPIYEALITCAVTRPDLLPEEKLKDFSEILPEFYTKSTSQEILDGSVIEFIKRLNESRNLLLSGQISIRSHLYNKALREKENNNNREFLSLAYTLSTLDNLPEDLLDRVIPFTKAKDERLRSVAFNILVNIKNPGVDLVNQLLESLIDNHEIEQSVRNYFYNLKAISKPVLSAILKYNSCNKNDFALNVYKNYCLSNSSKYLDFLLQPITNPSDNPDEQYLINPISIKDRIPHSIFEEDVVIRFIRQEVQGPSKFYLEQLNNKLLIELINNEDINVKLLALKAMTELIPPSYETLNILFREVGNKNWSFYQPILDDLENLWNKSSSEIQEMMGRFIELYISGDPPDCLKYILANFKGEVEQNSDFVLFLINIIDRHYIDKELILGAYNILVDNGLLQAEKIISTGIKINEYYEKDIDQVVTILSAYTDLIDKNLIFSLNNKTSTRYERYYSAKILSKSCNQKYIQPILETVLSLPDNERANYIELLVNFGNPAVDAIKPLIQPSNPYLSILCLYVLKRIKTNRSYQTLID